MFSFFVINKTIDWRHKRNRYSYSIHRNKTFYWNYTKKKSI